MKPIYIGVGAASIMAVLMVSFLLIPDKKQLDYIQQQKPAVEDTTGQMSLEQKQADYEAKIAAGDLNPTIVSNLADVYIAQNQQDKAIAILERYRAANPKDYQMLDKLGTYYQTIGDMDKFVDVLEQENRIAPSTSVLQVMLMLYGTAHPDKTIIALRQYLQFEPDNMEKLKDLVFFLQMVHKDDEAAVAIKELKKRYPKEINYTYLYPLVDTLIKEGQFAEAYGYAEEWIKQTPEPAVLDFGRMFYNANRADLTLKLMAYDKDNIDKDPALFLLNLKASVAANPKDVLKMAQNWMKGHPTDMNMLQDVGNVFFTTKRFYETKELLSPSKPRFTGNKTLLDLYRESLGASVKDHPENIPELVEVFKEELAKPETTEARKKEIVIRMMDLGAGQAALPYTQKYALEYRGDWLFLHEAFLQKFHMTAQLADFRYKYVHSATLTDKERTYFASIYMEQGNKEQAEPLLWQLAYRKPADDSDVRTLLYLWGVKPSPGQLSWIEDRATAATGAEKVKWLQILMNVRAYDRIVHVIDAIPMDTRSPELETMYYTALDMSGQKTLLADELGRSIDHTQDEKRLVYFSNMAMDRGLYRSAARGYDRLLVEHPDNNEYLKNRGLLAYDLQDNTAAETFLSQYHARGGREARPTFIYAELLHAHKSPIAPVLYQETLASLAKRPEMTTEERMLKVRSLARLGRNPEADTQMRELLVQNSDNPYIETDYMEFLIDTKDYAKAEALLTPSAKLPVVKRQPAPWIIKSKQIVSIEYTNFAYELLLVYKRPTSEIPEVKELQRYHPGWIEAVYPGYDKVLLIASQQSQLTASYQGADLVVSVNRGGANDTKKPDHALEVRKELLHARLEQETGHQDAALDRLYALKNTNPDDTGVLTTLAVAERGQGRHLAALDLANQAHAENPQDLWAGALLADLQKEDAAYIRTDHQWIHLTNNDRFDSEISGVVPVSRNVRLGAAFDNVFYDFKNLQRADGSFGSASGNAQRGQIDGIYVLEAGPVSKTSLFLNPDSVGAGEQMSFHDQLGTINVYGEYNRADWTFTERIPDDVTRDRVGAVQAFSPYPEVYGIAGVAATNYNQASKDSVTQSASLNGSIQAPVGVLNSDWSDLPFTVGYGLDAEYVTSSEFGTSALGDRYRLYPLVSREVHALDVGYRHDFYDNLVGQMYGSYAYDRMSGDSGPSIGASLTKDWENGWEAQVRAGRGISFTENGSGVITAGGYLIYRFK